MTVVYQDPASKAEPDRAWTHVLVIGIGAYPHIGKTTFSAKPLGSPAKAAVAIAQWFISGAGGDLIGFHNPDAPLGSLALLASPRLEFPTASGTKRCDVPEHSAVVDAVDAWCERLGSNPATRAVLHVCGHGFLDVDDQVVLADDFGVKAMKRLWERAFNLNTTLLGLVREHPCAFFMFVDACMEVDRDLLLEQGVRPQGLVKYNAAHALKTTEYAMLRATAPGLKAYADEDSAGEVSAPRFSKALVKALQGFCGRQVPGTQRYRVTWPVLRDAVAELLERENRASTDRQVLGLGPVSGGNAPLHILTRKPSVLLSLDVVPPGFRAAATVYIEGRAFPRQRVPLTAAGPVELEVPQAPYEIGVEPRSNEFAPLHFDDEMLFPAWREFPIKVI